MGKKKDRKKRLEAARTDQGAVQEPSPAKVLKGAGMPETDLGVTPATLDEMASGRSLPQRVADFTFIDVISVVVVLALSAILLFEAYHRAGYSKEIVALFGVVVGYVLGKTR
jgi:hypothetical protein